MATAEKRVVTDATGQAILAELRKIPGVMNPVPVEKGGTGVTTPEEIRELIGAQEKFDFDVEEQLNAAVKSVNNVKPDADGNVRIMHVATADNFRSDEAQAISGVFIERTTGGDASINDGNMNLGVLYGNSVRRGYSAESKNMDVQLVGRLDDSEPMSAVIDWDTFKAAVEYISTNKTFTYTSAWNENPETYGITISGTPANGDVINVYFIAENRGTIVNATPETFVETNWNLYDNETGYARVLKYSDEYGFKIGGTYTSVAFATTVEGAQTVVTPDSDGLFTIPEDGYIFVAGGNDTDTYVLMTWSDWDDGYTGDFAVHSEDVIDITELMGNAFPYGMCAIGVVYDEINFSDQVAYVRIERQTYTTENRILAEQSGRAFTYDEDYLYIVKETPDRVRFNISNQMTVYDHGTEYFTGTTLPILTYQLFGQNLKDKLRREVVAVTPQNFSVAQKAIARQNIDAAYDGEVIKTINHKVPDAYGDITIIEGTGESSYGMYRVNAVIPPAAWQLNNGAYQVTYADPLINSTMDGTETWLDDPSAMLGKTRFTTIDGGLVISTAVLPTATWNLHVSLAANGSQVLEEVYNKAEENTVALVEHGNTAFHSIAAGQYVLWKGSLYKATTAISANDLLASSGNGANLSAISDGISNELRSMLVAYITGMNKLAVGPTIPYDRDHQDDTLWMLQNAVTNKVFTDGVVQIGTFEPSGVGFYIGRMYSNNNYGTFLVLCGNVGGLYKVNSGTVSKVYATNDLIPQSVTVTALHEKISNVFQAQCYKLGQLVFVSLYFKVNDTAISTSAAQLFRLPYASSGRCDIIGMNMDGTGYTCLLNNGGNIISRNDGTLKVGWTMMSFVYKTNA